jgi:hypothetical protein
LNLAMPNSSVWSILHLPELSLLICDAKLFCNWSQLRQ